MREFRDLTEFASMAGHRLGESSWHHVAQERVDRFAETTGDSQWIHVDAARAASGPFGGTIAHGYLMLSLIPMLLAEIYRINEGNTMINTTVDRLWFSNAVPVGADVRLVADLASVRARARGAVDVVINATIEIRHRPKPALMAAIGFIVRPAVLSATTS